MPKISDWDVLVLLAAAGSALIGPFLMLAAIVLLAVPSLRRTPRWQRVAAGLLGTTAVLLVIGGPMLSELVPELLGELLAPLRLSARTRHPSRPTTYDGITFPPGSTVLLTSSMGGAVESATVPAPTAVLGIRVGKVRRGCR